jgi:hypothetical protein
MKFNLAFKELIHTKAIFIDISIEKLLKNLQKIRGDCTVCQAFNNITTSGLYQRALLCLI